MTKADAREVARTTALLATKGREQGLARDPVEDALTLHRIAGSLHRYDERSCSEDLGCRECDGDGEGCRACGGYGTTIGKRVANLERKAQTLAAAYGFRAYFQGDCRGCPLYLIPETYPATEDASAQSDRARQDR